MNPRLRWSFAAIAVLFSGAAAMAQANIPDASPQTSALLPPARLDSPSASSPIVANANPVLTQTPANPPLHFSKAKFALLSAAVYGAAFADMHQTLQVRDYSWWRENDPLARPLVRLPTPAYYATGLALATGVNWLGWKMAHSRRWHRLSPIPQLLSVSGNLYGFHSNFR
jgi:hypothetical protein